MHGVWIYIVHSIYSNSLSVYTEMETNTPTISDYVQC